MAKKKAATKELDTVKPDVADSENEEPVSPELPSLKDEKSVEPPVLPSAKKVEIPDHIVSTVQSALSHKGHRVLVIRGRKDFEPAKRYLASLDEGTVRSGEFTIKVNPRLQIPSLWRRL